MVSPQWQLKHPIQAVVFDCDGTLSSIEGIDELAREHTIRAAVKALTHEAMSTTGINQTIYAKRLDLIQPTQPQVLDLGDRYFAHRTEDAIDVIRILMRLNKEVYVISAGLLPAVLSFGKKMNIPEHHIIAVDISFDSLGHYETFDTSSPLTHCDGKKSILATLKNQHPHIVFVGDGMNDVAVIPHVDRFVGYGGAYFRSNIEKLSHFYIKTSSISPLLPLSLTANEVEHLTSSEKHLYNKGVVAIDSGNVTLT